MQTHYRNKISRLAESKKTDIIDGHTRLLIGTEKAKFVNHQLEEPIGYAQACINMIGKSTFCRTDVY